MTIIVILAALYSFGLLICAIHFGRRVDKLIGVTVNYVALKDVDMARHALAAAQLALADYSKCLWWPVLVRRWSADYWNEARPANKRKGERRRVERRAGKIGVNVRCEDKDKPQGWEPKRIKRAKVERKEATTSKWQPIETAPLDGEYVLVAGDSGYTTTPLRVEVCRFDFGYRPLSPWVNHANDGFTDGGEPPIYWMPLPEPPEVTP